MTSRGSLVVSNRPALRSSYGLVDMFAPMMILDSRVKRCVGSRCTMCAYLSKEERSGTSFMKVSIRDIQVVEEESVSGK